MAKDGKKLELFEILAAKRATGKVPLGLDAAKPAKQANAPEPDMPDVLDAPGMIIDDAVSAEVGFTPPQESREPERDATRKMPSPSARDDAPAPLPASGRTDTRADARTDTRVQRKDSSLFRSVQEHAEAPAPAPELVPARPKSPRELVVALDTALITFTVVMMLVACAYFIGYKRGQEERPAGIVGAAEIETADPSRVNIRNLAPPPRAAVRPPEQDFTLIIRKEPAASELPERLELELAEALTRGSRDAGRELPGFIFRTSGADPQYILAVGLGATANDEELARLLKIYNDMEGITLSSQERPYLGCRIAPVRELGAPVY